MKKKMISLILSVTIITTFAFTLNVGIDKSTVKTNKTVISDIYPPIWIPDSVPSSHS